MERYPLKIVQNVHVVILVACLASIIAVHVGVPVIHYPTSTMNKLMSIFAGFVAVNVANAHITSSRTVAYVGVNVVIVMKTHL